MKARPIGRLLRLLAGSLLVAILVPLAPTFGSAFLVRASALFFAIAGFYVLLDRLISTRLTSLNPWLGAALANVPLVILYFIGAPGGLLLGQGEGQIAMLTYLALALVIAAIRADGGCEVMSIPGILFQQRTYLACIAFWPIDWLEARLSANKTS